MTIVYAVVSTKGGTGKTNLAKFLGFTLAQQNKRVLAIDLCQNSDIATRLGYDRYQFTLDAYDWVSGQANFEDVVVHDDETGIDFIPASAQVDKITEYASKVRTINQEFILKEKIDQIKQHYDYIILDNHPTETHRLPVFSLVACDIALVPTPVDMSALVASLRVVDLIKDLQNQSINIQFAVVPMAVDFSRGMKKYLDIAIKEFEEAGAKYFTTPIRYSTAVAKSGFKEILIDNDDRYLNNVLADYKLMAKDLDEFFLKQGV